MNKEQKPEAMTAEELYRQWQREDTMPEELPVQFAEAYAAQQTESLRREKDESKKLLIDGIKSFTEGAPARRLSWVSNVSKFLSQNR